MPWLTTYLFQENAGVSAIYVSGAFAASLSTVSSALSSMANALVSDFLYHWTNKLSEKKQLIICKSLVLFLGGCCIGFAYMAASLRGGILEAALAIPAIVGGPTWGVFMLAVFFPFVEFIGVSGKEKRYSIEQSLKWACLREWLLARGCTLAGTSRRFRQRLLSLLEN